MKLPISIEPCPIVEAVVDVRFESLVPEDAIFGVVYQALRNNFPNASALPMASVLPEMRRADPLLALQPLHKLEGEKDENLTVLIGSQGITVGVRGAYPGWTGVAERFKTTFASVASTGIVGRPLRFGLRYINFFAEDIFPNLTLSVKIDDVSVTGEGTFFKTVLPGKKCRLLLQVGKDLSLTSEQGKTGSVVDIDSFVSEPDVSTGFDSAIASFLEDAHLAEKHLFFSLLKPAFLSSLNPKFNDVN